MKIFSKKYVKLPIIIAVIAALVLGIVDGTVHTRHSKSASTTIEFLFDSAADGLAPNGEVLDIGNIKETESIDAAIKAAGYDFEAEAVKNCISISGTYPQSYSSSFGQSFSLLDLSNSKEVGFDSFVPTKYTVSLSGDFSSSVSRADLKKLLSAIMDEYVVFFAREYSAKLDWSLTEDVESSEEEYVKQVDVMSRELSLLENYGTKLAEVAGGFDMDGDSFDDFLASCSSLRSNVIGEISAFIYSNGISKDADALIALYQREQQELLNEKKVLSDRLNKTNDLIDSYKRDSSVYVGLNAAVKENSEETYEALLAIKREIAGELADTESEIVKIKDNIESVKAGSGEKADKNAAAGIEESLAGAWERLSALKARFAALCEGYNSKNVSAEVLHISDASAQGAVSTLTAIIKSCVKFGIAAIGLAFMYILAAGMVLEIQKRRKER